MAKYLVEANYVGDGVKGLIKEGGAGRRDAVSKLVKSLGGKLESIYFALGDVDVYAIVDLPDNSAAAAASLIVNASGTVHMKTTALLTPAELDAATQQTPKYRAPGE
jgi:uncharacterized protein with GYD domain